jgi:hypothetical protein
MMDLIPPHADYGLLILLFVLAAVFFALSIRRRTEKPLCAFLSGLLAFLLLICGLNYIRIIPPIDRVMTPAPTRVADTQICRQMASQAVSLGSPTGFETKDDTGVLCPVQSVLVPFVAKGKTLGPSLVPVSACWPDDQPTSEFAPLCYQLGFLEMDGEGTPLAPLQMAAIRSTIEADHAAGHEVYVIGFVHGWRNDAAIGNGNVRDLRVEAAYAAAHLRERCRVTGQHCGAQVFALYFSWPAAIGIELPDKPIPCWMTGHFKAKNCDKDRQHWSTLSALLTFPSRKLVSDAVGTNLLLRVDTIRSFLGAHDYLLLIGHSLGGNAIITGAAPRVRNALKDAATAFDQAGRPDPLAASRLGLPADLTVLINPASEARKLLDLRAAEASLFASNPKMTWPSSDPSHPAITPGALRRYWPADMPPRLLIAAARCDERGGEDAPKQKGEAETCDTVVERAFPLSQKYVVGTHDPLQWTGIGHMPRYSRGDLLASTHDVHVNGQRGALKAVLPRTTYTGAYAPNFRCVPEPSWLLDARLRTDDQPQVHRRVVQSPAFSWWDLGAGEPHHATLGLLATQHAPGQSNIQFAYPAILDKASCPSRGILLPNGKCHSTIAVRAYAQNSDPIWAVHANRTFITTHSAFVSAPLFCAISKLVLDRPAQDGGAHDQYFERDAADFRIRAMCAAKRIPAPADVQAVFGRQLPNHFWDRCQRTGLSPFPG